MTTICEGLGVAFVDAFYNVFRERVSFITPHHNP